MNEIAARRRAVAEASAAREAARRRARDVEAQSSLWRRPDGTWEQVDAGLNPEIFARIEQLMVEFDAAAAGEQAAEMAYVESGLAYDTEAMAADAIAGDEPVLLLPVRIEAVYTEGVPELRIRVYPDDVHVDGHEEALTDGEHAAGTAYWTAVHAATDAIGREAAWRDLVRACAGARAAWVATVLTPGNQPPDPPSFPTVERRAAAWTRAAETTLLPDHFEFSAYRGGALIWRLDGAPIPSPLAVGLLPDPDDGEPEEALPFDPASRWLIDFETAERCGMAVVAPLTEVDERFDLLTVVGISSADAATGAQRLQRTLNAHAYTGGLAAIPVGTPTNNTPGSRSGWRSRTAPPDPQTAADRRAGFDPASGQDAARLSRAFGIDGAALLAAVCEPDDGDVALLRRLHRLQAEFYSWSRSFRPTSVEDAAPTPIDEPWFAPIADHFTSFVRARGPLPPLRIGRQPYGILPISSIDLWRGTDLAPGLVDVVSSFLDVFRSSIDGAAQVGEETDQDSVLLELLGRAGAPRRIINDYDFNHRDLGQGPPPAAVGAIPATRRLAWQGVDGGPGPDEPGGDPSRRVEAFPDTVPPELTTLIAEHPLTQLLVVFDEALHMMRDTMLAPVVEEHDALYFPLARRLGQLREVPTRSTFYDQAEWTFNALHNYTRGGPATPQDISRRLVEATRFRNLFARFVAFEDDLAADVARIERLLCEVLETLSHRIDAWVTSIATARLAAMRDTAPVGIRIGSYGWLTDVERRTPNPTAQGFIMTPSLHHATTAAVLRSGWQAHSDRTAFAVDVQSARVRRALAVIEGVRGGQTVAALLGYQFERALHDAQLDRFIAGFRVAYPLAPVVEPAAPGSAEAKVSVGARNVVDGQLLRSDRIRLDDDALQTVIGVEPGEQAATIRRFISELDETFDAVGDLLVAESVHQLVAGNPVRAGLAADGAGRGLELPIEFDVLRTPRAGLAATHHVVVAYPPPGRPGWSGDRPLARLEPRLEAWVRTQLGSAAAWGLDDALDGWCALDALVATPEALMTAVGAAGARVDDLVLLCERLRSALAGATPLLPSHLDPTVVGPSALDLGELHGRVAPWVGELRVVRDRLATATIAEPGTGLADAIALGVPVADTPGGLDRARALLGAVPLDDLGAPPDPVADPVAASAWLARVTSILRELLHPAVVVAPVITGVPIPPPPSPAPGLDQLDRWRRDCSLVRPALDRLDQALALAEIVAAAPLSPLTVVQPTVGGVEQPWIATAAPQVAWPPSAAVVTGDLHESGAGVVVDTWTEVVPGAAGPNGPEEVTGVAFEFDRPGARAPQVALLAVPPDRRRGWCTEDLHACVEEALLLAKVRTLDLDDVPSLKGVLPVPDGQS